MSGIYEPKGKAREYSPLALNYYSGCSHGCLYCYVKPMMGRFRTDYNHNHVSIEQEKKLKEIEKSAKLYSGTNKQVLLSFTSDVYNEYDTETKFTREVLEVLLKNRIPVSILTKGGARCLRDIDIFKKYKDRIKVGATLTFDNDKDSISWEPGGALPKERIETLKALHGEGIKTWVSFEPVISTEQTIALAKKTLRFVDYYKIGKLNNYKGLDKGIDWSSFLSTMVGIMEDNNKEYYIKKDLLAFNKTIRFEPKRMDQDYLTIGNFA